jgi:hypothetical protein
MCAALIIFQVINIILDENNIQKDSQNVFYITTNFIIDVPIRFILKDFVDSPFEEIYFFSILDIVLIGFIIHYCEGTYEISPSYTMISMYGTIFGLIINLIFFYGFRFSPPMALVPLFINIFSLIGYAVCKKQFFDFMDLEKYEKKKEEEKELIEKSNENQMVSIDMKNIGNISFTNNLFVGEEMDKFKKVNEKNKVENEEELEEDENDNLGKGNNSLLKVMNMLDQDDFNDQKLNSNFFTSKPKNTSEKNLNPKNNEMAILKDEDENDKMEKKKI